MRRKEQEITEQELIEDILERALILHLGLADAGCMCIFPVNFAYRDGYIYLHSNPEGTKVRLIRENPAVAFEAETDVAIIAAPVACAWGMHYRSVMGQGQAEIIEDQVQKVKALNILMAKHTHATNINYDFDRKNLNRTCVIRIRITEMTAKHSKSD